MMPIAPLMIEHRLIERMIAALKVQLVLMKNSSIPDIVFIERAVDFIRTYADQTHHGKEEDILFRELKKKQLTADDRKSMEDLIQDHVKAREMTRGLVAAKDRYLGGDKSALVDILSRIEFLVDFYPQHIQKEDKSSFIPFMKYFSKVEQDAMLQEGREFDRKMIHRKYEKLVLDAEAALDIKDVKMKAGWMDYL